MTENNVPIKLRAWDDIKKEFAIMTLSDGSKLPSILPAGEWALGVWNQFTGFVDRKAIEIWEGDLVQINGVVYEVIKKPGVFWLVDAAGNEWSALYVQNFKTLEVIGNKYENPELLK
jgi:hypothetical protein